MYDFADCNACVAKAGLALKIIRVSLPYCGCGELNLQADSADNKQKDKRKPFSLSKNLKQLHHMSNHKQHSVRQQTFSSDALTAPSRGLRMQPAELFQDEAFETTTTLKQKKYCRQCWREDFHFRTSYSPILFGFLIVATFGLSLIHI